MPFGWYRPTWVTLYTLVRPNTNVLLKGNSTVPQGHLRWSLTVPLQTGSLNEWVPSPHSLVPVRSVRLGRDFHTVGDSRSCPNLTPRDLTRTLQSRRGPGSVTLGQASDVGLSFVLSPPSRSESYDSTPENPDLQGRPGRRLPPGRGDGSHSLFHEVDPGLDTS